jgi:hypothetical protein
MVVNLLRSPQRGSEVRKVKDGSWKEGPNESRDSDIRTIRHGIGCTHSSAAI